MDKQRIYRIINICLFTGSQTKEREIDSEMERKVMRYIYIYIKGERKIDFALYFLSDWTQLRVTTDEKPERPFLDQMCVCVSPLKQCVFMGNRKVSCPFAVMWSVTAELRDIPHFCFQSSSEVLSSSL